MRNRLAALVLLLSVLSASAQTNYGPNNIYYQSTIPNGSFNLSAWNKNYRVDANGDGLTDAVAMSGTSILVYTATADGGFAVTSVSAGAYAFPNYGATAAGDLNNDGKIDFVWYNSANRDLIVSYWSANGTNNLPQYTAPARLNLTGFANASGTGTYHGIYGVNTADIDGDGDVDVLAFGPNGTQRPHMIINNGDGTFTRYDLHATAAYQSFSLVTDWNSDGRQDVLVPENGGISLYLNNGNAGTPLIPSFTKSTLVTSANADGFDFNNGLLEAIDFNKDGKKDLLLNYMKNVGGIWYNRTRIFINTTTAPPTYTFAATDLLNDANSPRAVLGGFGARYEDVDGNGMLDIIGIRGGNGTQALHKLTVNRLSIDASNVVSVTESTLIDNGPLTAGGANAGMDLAIDDVDGDGKQDYLVAYSSMPNVVSYRTLFPQFIQSTLTAFSLSDKVFVGGSKSDNATLTLSATGGSGTYSVPVSNGATISGGGTGTVTIAGTVAQINHSLSNASFTPAANGHYTLDFSLTNALNQTYTNSLKLAQGVWPLPVNGLTLTAAPKGTAIQVAWQTLSEKNTLDFLVQHSSDGNVWAELGSVKAKGNNNSTSYYQFVHQWPRKGSNFYRLVQNDLDGRSSLSKVVTVTLSPGDSKLTIYPNPVIGKNLSVVLDEDATIQVIDARGIPVLQKKMQKGLHELNLNGLASGVYSIQAGRLQAKFILP